MVALKKALYVVVTAAVLLAIALLLSNLWSHPSGNGSLYTQGDQIWRTLSNTEYDFQFSYPIEPKGYEAVALTGAKKPSEVVYEMALYEKQTYRSLSATDTLGSELPPAITLRIFDAGTSTSALDWVLHSKNSNYVSAVPLATSRINNLAAITYEEDGLYRAQSVAVRYEGRMYVLSAQFITRDDAMVLDFKPILQTFKFLNAEDVVAPTCTEIVESAYSTTSLAKVTPYYGTPAVVDFTTYPNAATFRTKISEGASGGSTFAGHYAVAEWGCGSECQNYAVVDSVTGAIIAYGFGSTEGALYTKESRLLVTNPPEAYRAMATATAQEKIKNATSTYYVLSGEGSEAHLNAVCTQSVSVEL